MKQKELFPDLRIRFLENAILIENKILVFGDLHIGEEEMIIRGGLAPRTQFKEITRNFSRIIGLLEKQGIKKLDKIILLGDLKHEYEKISKSEWREALCLLDFMSKKTEEIILIKGNHDNILGPIAGKRKIQLKPYYQYKDILFVHGHKRCLSALKDRSIRILILGHLHPAVSLEDSYKKEKYKCFLFGKYRQKEIYILPSFNAISSGRDLARDYGYKSEFFIVPQKNLNSFVIFIYNPRESKIYDFGKLKKLRDCRCNKI